MNYGNQRLTPEELFRQKAKTLKRLVIGGFLGILGLTLFFGAYDIVPPGHRGIVIHAGAVQNEVLPEGFTFKLPFYTTIKSVPVRVQESTIKTQAASRDMQKVHTTLSINWHISPDKVNDVFKRLGEAETIQATVINNAVSEVLKGATAKMSAEEILAKRNELKTNIDEELIRRLQSFNLTVDTVNLSDFDFEPEFNKAVEEKQIAEQNAKKAQYLADQAKVDAEAAVNRARGEATSKLLAAESEAKAIALKQKSITHELIEYEKVQKWDGTLPQVMSGSGGGMMLNFKLNKQEKKDE